MIKVFYDKRQSARSNESFSPSAQKPEQVVKIWQKHFPISMESFGPATTEEISLVHDERYVQSVLSCKTNNGFGNKSAEIAEALPWVVGSMVSAAVHAFKTKESCFSPTSGAHHAGYFSGGGFCTFNHLVLAACMAHQKGARKIGLIDLDCHYGDGSQDILDHLNIDYIEHYTFGRRSPAAGSPSDEWLKKLPQLLFPMKDCDLLIYNAGVDPHINDPLGGILTTEQMYKRDLIVYEFAVANKIPIVTSLAGGYQRDKDGSINPVLELHNNTMKAFVNANSIGGAL
ncbi:MAG: histone deacetylase [Bdellovibrionaceae bacterium]|nr:histone deacetylase [Pseudobdellovibrionaceae bacterium]